jgi:hypothetical protein
VARGPAHQRHDAGRVGLALPDPDEARVGADDDEAVVIGAVEEADVRVLDADVDRLDVGDLHVALPDRSRPFPIVRFRIN